MGYIVDTACNGVEALNAVAAQPHTYSLILMDLSSELLALPTAIAPCYQHQLMLHICMSVLCICDGLVPVMDGLSAVVELRARGCRAPVVALSGNTMQDEKSRALAAGFSAFLAKPASKQDLQHLIESFAVRPTLAYPQPLSSTPRGPAPAPVPATSSRSPPHFKSNF
jgi:CheY-like chemotaxis protein